MSEITDEVRAQIYREIVMETGISAALTREWLMKRANELDPTEERWLCTLRLEDGAEIRPDRRFNATLDYLAVALRKQQVGDITSMHDAASRAAAVVVAWRCSLPDTGPNSGEEWWGPISERGLLREAVNLVLHADTGLERDDKIEAARKLRMAEAVLRLLWERSQKGVLK